MKALILGAAGQVGRALLQAAPRGARAVGMDRAACDIADPAQVDRAIADVAPDVVFNAAAYTAVDQAEAEPGAAHALNAVAPGIIAAAARRAGSRIVHLSTDFVFDGRASTPYRPGDLAAPLSVYGRTKLAGEQEVASADPSALILRTAWVYSAGGANFVSTMLRLMDQRDEIQVVADQVGTPTHAASLARASWALAAGGAEGIFHYTDAGVASWYDFAVAIEEEARAAGLIGKKVAVVPTSTEHFPTPARRPRFSVLDKSAAWARIGTAPHWRVNLRSALQDWKAHG